MRSKLFRLHYYRRKTNEKECDKDQLTKYIHIIPITTVAFTFLLLFSPSPSSFLLTIYLSLTHSYFLLIASFILTVIEIVCICIQPVFQLSQAITAAKKKIRTRKSHILCGKKQIRNGEKNLIIGAFKRFWMQIRTNTVSELECNTIKRCESSGESKQQIFPSAPTPNI